MFIPKATNTILAAALAAAPAAVQAADDGDFLYEPGCYIQDGLVLNLDGIRNVGAMKPHSFAAPVWKDLSATGNDAAMTIVNFGGAWLADGFRFERNKDAVSSTAYAYGTLISEQDFGERFTVQIVAGDVSTTTVNGLYSGFFGVNDGNLCNIYQMHASTEVHFKADEVTGLAVGTRARINPWSGRYINAALDGGRQSITEDTAFSPWRGQEHAGASLGPVVWELGAPGTNDSARAMRALKGTIKAIRVYNRVLSAAELAENRAIDEARFFTGIPVTNVVVATSVAGLEANEPSGAYALKASGHVFSAPASVEKGAVSYELAGYALERWDGAEGAWSAPVTNADASSYAASQGECVRLTWLWSKARSSGFDAAFAGYVTDGLVLHLDGIRNFGVDEPHDPSAARWVNLATASPGIGGMAAFTHLAPAAKDPWTNSVASGWTPNGFYFNGHDYATMSVSMPEIDGEFTMQAVGDVDFALLQERDEMQRLAGVSRAMFPSIIGSADSGGALLFAQMFGYESTLRDSFRCNVRSGEYIGAYLYDWAGRYATGMLRGDGDTSLFQTATPTVWKNYQGRVLGTRTAMIGGSYGSDSSAEHNYRQHLLVGLVHSVRIYDRALTDAELAQNRAVDEARFFGGAPLSATGDVIVISDTAETAFQSGSYSPDGGYRFTSPATYETESRSWSLIGYTVERWEAGAWVHETDGDGDSWTCPEGEGWASRRLTWRWRVSHGLNSLGVDHEVGEYVQDGLVLNFDGICNAGADALHDGATNVWTDLSPSRADAAITVVNGGGAWTNDGFRFERNLDSTSPTAYAYGTVGPALDFGSEFTVQIVADDVSTNRVNSLYPGFFGVNDGNKCNIYQMHAADEIHFKADGVTGLNVNTRSRVKSWGGQYLNAALSNGWQTVTERAAFRRAEWAGCETNVVIGPVKWMLGAPGDGDSGRKSRALKGTINAIRVYDRVLSNDELARNRFVDEARFKLRGRINVVVAEGKYDTTTEPSGNYEVEGSWTFTALPAFNERGHRRDVVGYVIEAWNAETGKWGPKQSFPGDSYTHVVGESAAKVRLTWKWAGERFMVIYR